MRGGQLTDRMPHQHIRSHTPRLHQPEQRHLQREQPRLGIDSPLQQPRILTEHHPTQRQLKIHPRTHRVKSIREHRERTVQLPAHTQPLRTLPREQQRQAAVHDLAGHRVLGVLAEGEGGQCGSVGVEDHGTVRQFGTRGGQGVRQVDGVRVHSGEQRGLPGECVRRGAGQQDGQRDVRALASCADGCLRAFRSLFQDGVRVGPADPEGGHPGTARTGRSRPGAVLREQFDRPGRPVDLGGRLVHVQRGREDPAPQRHDGLDHAHNTGGGLGVPDVGLHRPQVEGFRAVLAVGREQRLGLDRIAQPRARTVRLHEIDVGRLQSGRGERGADHPLL